MSKPKKPAGPRKGTIAALVQRILALAAVPADAEIIANVKAEHRGTKFDEKHLAWYKSQFRQGKLAGQKEGVHVVAQKPKAKKHAVRTKPAPKAKKAKKATKALVPKKRVEAPVEAAAATA